MSNCQNLKSVDAFAYFSCSSKKINHCFKKTQSSHIYHVLSLNNITKTPLPIEILRL